MDNKHPYKKLARRTFLQGLCITATVSLVVLVFRFFTHGKFANKIVSLIQWVCPMSYDEAWQFYVETVPENMEYILAFLIIILMLLLFGWLLRSYVKYFDEVVAGIEQIQRRENSHIKLSPELDFVEQKLNWLLDTLNKREAELKNSQKQKNEMIVYLAHDIRTPLTSVLGYLNLVADNPDMPPKLKEKYIGIALTKAERLEVLVNEFFEITSYELHVLPLNKRSIDFCLMAEQMADEMYPMQEKTGKTIVNNVPQNFKIYGDGDKLARAFNNILKNALSYADDSIPISIEAKEIQGKSLISFVSGGSISENEISKVFDKFCRLNTARPSDKGGSGLGLAIAKSIAELHGGRIYAESGEGKVVFTFELPTDEK